MKNNLLKITLVMISFLLVFAAKSMDTLIGINGNEKSILTGNSELDTLIKNKEFRDSLEKYTTYDAYQKSILFNTYKEINYSTSSKNYPFYARLPFSENDKILYQTVDEYIADYKNKYSHLEFKQLCYAFFIGLYEQFDQHVDLQKTLCDIPKTSEIVYQYTNDNQLSKEYGVWIVGSEGITIYYGKNAIGKFLTALKNNPQIFAKKGTDAFDSQKSHNEPKNSFSFINIGIGMAKHFSTYSYFYGCGFSVLIIVFIYYRNALN